MHVVAADGSLERVAVAHVDPAKLTFAEELESRYPPAGDDPTLEVLRTQHPVYVAEITEELLDAAAVDDLHRGLLRELGPRSSIAVPLLAGDEALGVITFVQTESGRAYGDDDLALVLELARRVATAMENARLYAEAERRAQAASALANVGDAVVLADADGVVRLWNPAAATITGISETAAVGRRLEDVIPGWRTFAQRIPVASGPGQTVTALTLPVELDGREVWLSGSGVGFAEGVVYAFRDLTEERRVEEMKSDFVATVSHELRTPLAAIRGSALTILRPDLELEDELKGRLLEVIADESAAARADRQRPPARVAPRLGAAAAADRELRRGRARPARRRGGADAPARQRHGSSSTPTRRCRRSRPTRASCARCSRTSSRTRSSTRRTAARSSSGSGATTARSASACVTRASGSPTPSTGASSRSSTASTRT